MQDKNNNGGRGLHRSVKVRYYAVAKIKRFIRNKIHESVHNRINDWHDVCDRVAGQ